jgi:hypothetical protein
MILNKLTTWHRKNAITFDMKDPTQWRRPLHFPVYGCSDLQCATLLNETEGKNTSVIILTK